jgi:hypothetical protein
MSITIFYLITFRWTEGQARTVTPMTTVQARFNDTIQEGMCKDTVARTEIRTEIRRANLSLLYIPQQVTYKKILL